MTNGYKTIGIVCIGPEATTNLYLKIIHLFQKKFHSVYDNEFPEFITRGIPLPDVVTHNLADSEIKKMLLRAVKQLKRSGAEFIIIPCNTVHEYVPYILPKAHLPILSIVDETIKVVEARGVKKVLLLATKNTVESGMYSEPLTERGIKVVKPKKKDQDVVGEVISDGLAGKKTKKDHMRLVRLINKYSRTDGIDGAILGCTELPLLITQKDVDEKIKIFDTLEVLASAAFVESTNHENPQG